MMVEPYASTMVRSYQKTLDIAFNDKIRYKSQGTQSALLLLGYFNNIKSSRDSAQMYLTKGLEIDSTNAQLKSIKEIFDKQPVKGTNQKSPTKTGNGKPSASIRKPSNKS